MRKLFNLKMVALVSVLIYGGLTGYTLLALLDLQDELAVDVGENMVWAAGQATYQSSLLHQALSNPDPNAGFRVNPALQRELVRGRFQVLLAPTQQAFMRRAGVLDDLQLLRQEFDAGELSSAQLQTRFYDLGRRIMLAERELAGARRDAYSDLMRQLIFFIFGVMGSGAALFLLLLGSMRKTQLAHEELTAQHRQGQQLLAQLNHERQVRERYRDFVSLMSHQLRTPLAVIDSSAQRLVRAEVGAVNSMLTERSSRIRRAVRQLNQLISRVLQGLRVEEQGRHESFRLELARCDWQDVLQQSLDSFDDLLAQRPIELNFVDEAQGSRAIECDRLWCSEIVSNLLSNADKYSPAGLPIEIRTEIEDGVLSCHVLDRGPGIPEQDLPALFMPFFRGSNGSNTVGVGLGLSISQTLAKWHGGSVTARNRRSGGACFTLRLPLRADPRGEKM